MSFSDIHTYAHVYTFCLVSHYYYCYAYIFYNF